MVEHLPTKLRAVGSQQTAKTIAEVPRRTDRPSNPMVWRHGLSGEASILFSAGKEMDTLLIVLQGSQDVGADVHFLAPGAASRSAALTRLYTYYPAYRTK